MSFFFCRGVLTLALLGLGNNALAAISDVGTPTSAEANSGGTQTLTEITGLQSGDLVFVGCSIDAADGVWTDPDDFTEIDQLTTPSNEREYIGYKVRGADAGDGYEFAWSGSDEQVRCTMVAFRGVDGSTPLDVTYSQMSHYVRYAIGNETGAAQPITTATNGAVVLLVQFFHAGDGTITAGAPSGYDLIVDLQLANRSHFFATKTVATAGTETPGDWTHTDTSGGEVPANFTIALRPASVEGAGGNHPFRGPFGGPF